MKIQELRNKKIAIVGFAREGKDTLSFLEKVFPQKIKICGDLRRDPVSAKSQRPGLCKLGVFDENPDCLKIRRDLRRDRVSVNSQRPGLCKFRRDRVYVNSCLKGLKDYEVIIKTPGIPEKKIKPFINEKAKLTSQTEIFFANFQGLVIGVTGTKGKGTTSTLIYQILKKAKKKVRLVGNIGKPVLGEFLRAKKDEIFIYELSSHQLQGLYQIKKSPHIAVFLNLFPDHLDYYKNFQEYKKAKEPIFCFQTKNDYFIYNAKDKTAQEFAKKSRARKIDFTKVGLEKKGNVAEKIKTNLMGDFNLLNIKAAIAVAQVMEVGESKIKKAITEFKGLEHRLEYVGKVKGIDFYNDSMSTLPETAIKAIEAIKPQTLIAGGSDKGSCYKEMAKAIIKYKVKNLILLAKSNLDPVSANLPRPGLGCLETGEIILKELRNELGSFRKRPGRFRIFVTDKMKEAVKIAFQETERGEHCLLSPGSAGFNLFKSYDDRGKQFKKNVRGVRGQTS